MSSIWPGSVSSSPEYESPVKEVVEDVGSRLVGLHLKSMLAGELLGTGQFWEGQALHCQQGPRCQTKDTEK